MIDYQRAFRDVVAGFSKAAVGKLIQLPSVTSTRWLRRCVPHGRQRTYHVMIGQVGALSRSLNAAPVDHHNAIAHQSSKGSRSIGFDTRAASPWLRNADASSIAGPASR